MNDGSSHLALYLNIPESAYEVAIGAVIDEVIPAQKSPIDIKYLEKSPSIGDSWFPKSTAFCTSIGLEIVYTDADVIIIGKSAVIKGDIYFRQTLKAEEGADIDGYIKRIDTGKSKSEEEIDIEEIVQRPEIKKPSLVPRPQKEAV